MTALPLAYAILHSVGGPKDSPPTLREARARGRVTPAELLDRPRYQPRSGTWRVAQGEKLLRVRAKPRRRIDRQDRAPVVETRKRQPGQHGGNQGLSHDRHRPGRGSGRSTSGVPTVMLGQQRHVHRGLHRLSRVGEFGQLGAPNAQALGEVSSEA